MTKRPKAEDNPKKALKLEDKLEEDQGYVSVLPAAGTKEQQRILKDMPKESKARTAYKGKKAATGDVLEKHLARENGLLEAAVYAREEGSLKTGLWIGCLVNTESLNRLHGYRALTERLHSLGLDRLSTDAEPTNARP